MSLIYILHIGDTKIKKINENKYLLNVLREDGNCPNEIRNSIGIVKAKLSRVLRGGITTLETKNRERNIFVIYVL